VAARRALPAAPAKFAGEALGLGVGDGVALGVGVALGDGEGDGDGVDVDGTHCWPELEVVPLALAMKKSAIDVAVATVPWCAVRSSEATWHCHCTFCGVPAWSYGPATWPCTYTSTSLV
jgi:hypothetical protein